MCSRSGRAYKHSHVLERRHVAEPRRDWAAVAEVVLVEPQGGELRALLERHGKRPLQAEGRAAHVARRVVVLAFEEHPREAAAAPRVDPVRGHLVLRVAAVLEEAHVDQLAQAPDARGKRAREQVVFGRNAAAAAAAAARGETGVGE